jgi:hypothetical protein
LKKPIAGYFGVTTSLSTQILDINKSFSSGRISAAGWQIFKPKIPIWVNFGRSRNGTFYCHLMYILRPFGIFCGYLVYFMVIWYVFPVLVCCATKNLATLGRISWDLLAAQSTLHKTETKKSMN